jgi:hypothetical protein
VLRSDQQSFASHSALGAFMTHRPSLDTMQTKPTDEKCSSGVAAKSSGLTPNAAKPSGGNEHVLLSGEVGAPIAPQHGIDLVLQSCCADSHAQTQGAIYPAAPRDSDLHAARREGNGAHHLLFRVDSETPATQRINIVVPQQPNTLFPPPVQPGMINAQPSQPLIPRQNLTRHNSVHGGIPIASYARNSGEGSVFGDIRAGDLATWNDDDGNPHVYDQEITASVPALGNATHQIDHTQRSTEQPTDILTLLAPALLKLVTRTCKDE